MKPSEKIEQLKQDLIELFGKDDSVIRAVELKETYLKIGLEFEQAREHQKYEEALLSVSAQFNVSESTAKRAISFTESLVHKNELT